MTVYCKCLIQSVKLENLTIFFAMTDDVKLFARPKVRFYQTDINESTAGESKRTIDQKHIRQSNKPKILSIVTLDKPVKLVKSNKSCNNQESKNLKTFDNTRKNLLTICTNAPSVYTLDENPIEIENQKPLSDNANIKNIKSNSKDIKSKISNKRSHNDIVPSSASLAAQDKNLNEVVKSQNYVKTNASRSYIKSKNGKENEMLDTKGNKYLTKKFSDLEITNHKSKSCSTRTTSKNANAMSKTLAASKRNLSTKSNVMPCHKYLKTASKVKSCPVKKTVIRDVIGPKIKPYIGPGILRKKHDDLKTPETDERTFMEPSISGEKLARPEYNSIMCTINKLNEMKKQQIVTDIEHLPAWYKHFVNGKISTALDFPLDEAIYKNLVDLSVDESQLPCRLIRSKDPEPRQKDAVPILSDFFIPVSTEEYCTSVSSKPRTSETAEIWNAFRVSDKIFEWKHILDHV